MKLINHRKRKKEMKLINPGKKKGKKKRGKNAYLKMKTSTLKEHFPVYKPN